MSASQENQNNDRETPPPAYDNPAFVSDEKGADLSIPIELENDSENSTTGIPVERELESASTMAFDEESRKSDTTETTISIEDDASQKPEVNVNVIDTVKNDTGVVTPATSYSDDVITTQPESTAIAGAEEPQKETSASRHISIDEDAPKDVDGKAYLPKVIEGDEIKKEPPIRKRRPSRVSIVDKPTIIVDKPPKWDSTARPGKPDTIWTISPNGKDIDDDDEEGEDRDTWDSPLEFLLSCISMSVGLGNVWRFPGTAFRNGGGAFLIPYLIVLLVIGRPLYYLEMCMGQFSRYGQVKVWNMAPLFKGVGYGAIVGVISVVSYYCALMAIAVYFFIFSFSKELPWSVCHPDDLPDGLTCEDQGVKGNEAEMYYKYTAFPQIEHLQDGLGTLHWTLALCLVFSWVLIFGSLVKGVKSSGKVAYFTAIFPYVVMLILLIRGVTLEGAGPGIMKFIEPDWARLKDPKVWYAAVEQCFFSLSAGFGPVIMFSSYNNFNQNVYKDALIISILDTFTSLLSGVTIFAVMGNLVATTDLEFEDVTGGPGLAFVLYPQAVAKFGGVPQLFAVLFFLMLFTLGIGSATSLTGGIITIICDQFTHWKRWIVTLVVCTCGASVGLLYVTEGGMLMLDLIDHYGAGFIIYIMAILECAGISYVYGLSNFCNDIEFMLGRKVGIYWRICWGFVIPVGLLANLIYYLATEPEFKSGDFDYPKIATICGWCLTAFAALLVPIWGIHAIATRKATSLSEKFKLALKPTPKWGPQRKKLRREWLAFKAKKEEEAEKRGILAYFC